MKMKMKVKFKLLSVHQKEAIIITIMHQLLAQSLKQQIQIP
jgi:hypothetical protein